MYIIVNYLVASLLLASCFTHRLAEVRRQRNVDNLIASSETIGLKNNWVNRSVDFWDE